MPTLVLIGMEGDQKFVFSGVPEAPNVLTAEMLNTRFGRENLSFVVMKAIETTFKHPVDTEYLERQTKIWNEKEEVGRGFSGASSKFYTRRTQEGALNVLYFPKSDSVMLEWNAN